MGRKALWLFLLVTALTFLAVACRDDVPEEGTSRDKAQKETVSPDEVDSAAVEGPAFGPVFYYAGPDAAGRSYASVFAISSAPGGVYGLLGLAALCDEGELSISIYHLPPTSQEQVAVSISLDGSPQEQQRWDTSKRYAATLGYAASSEQPLSLLAELENATRASIEIPELDVGPAEFDVEILLSTPVQERFERCGDDDTMGVIELAPIYRPIVDAAGSVSDKVSYKAETRRGNRVQTSVTYADPNHETALGGIEFVLTCKQDGNFNVELANLPRQTNQHSTELQELRVLLRLDRQPPREERWPIYSLSEGVEAHSPAPCSLMQALARSSSLLISLPELGISAVIADLPEMFSTPVQDNLGHCGYYVS